MQEVGNGTHAVVRSLTLCALVKMLFSLRKPAFAGLRIAQDLVEKSKGILSAANAVLIGAEHVVKISKRSLDIVNAEPIKLEQRHSQLYLEPIVAF